MKKSKTPKWMLEVRFRRFFENKFELRARDKKGALEDRILRGAFYATVLKEFEPEEIKAAIKYGIIKGDQIGVNGTVKNVLLWLDEECKYQPVWHKRQYQKLKQKFRSFLDRLRTEN